MTTSTVGRSVIARLRAVAVVHPARRGVVGEQLGVRDRALVLADGPDVVPLGLALVGGDLLAGLQQPQHEVRELARPARRQVVQRARLVDVDAHAHVVVERRLLAVADHAPLFGLDDAELDRHLLGMGGDGQRGALVVMEGDEVAVVQRGEDVAVHRDERLVEAGDGAQRARGALRLVLPVPVELKAVGEDPLLREVQLDELAEVADAEVDLLYARVRQAAHDVLEDRAVADRHERLGDDRRVGAQPRSEASGQDHGSHMTYCPTLKRPSLARIQSIVRATPSRSATRGSQPVNVRASAGLETRSPTSLSSGRTRASSLSTINSRPSTSPTISTSSPTDTDSPVPSCSVRPTACGSPAAARKPSTVSST